MEVIATKRDLQEYLQEWRSAREHVAIVPTMGNLHAGHTSLVDIAREHAERVVVSVFVNPKQFGEDEDFEKYPRTIEKDTLRLRQIRADVLFTPSVEEMYPFGIENATTVSVPYLADNFCGKFRPGHFEGVTTVVARLFAIVQPHTAIFGQKDYQQQLVIRRMVDDLGLPLSIVTAPTVREEDGLAMSSRNAYLSDKERAIAPTLHESLMAIVDSLEGGQRDFGKLEKAAGQTLRKSGFKPEYVAIRRAGDLATPDKDCRELVILAAAQLGNARLIDNVLATL